MNRPTTQSRRQFLRLAAEVATLPALAAAAYPSLASAEEAPVLRSPRFKAVASAFEQALQAADVPGAALAVYNDGKEEIATFGVTDLKSRSLVTPTTLFQNGSITKTYTATAVKRLAVEGRTNVHAPVREYLPDLRLADESVAQRVTPWHLMNRTSGIWGDAFIDTGDGDDALARFVAEVLPTVPQIHELGAQVCYSNGAVSLLGRVIEVVTGMTYRDAMQELLFSPLGLLNSRFDKDTITKLDHASGYGPGSDGTAEEITPLFLPRNIDPAGNIWTDIQDQIRYARFQIGADESPSRVLTKQELRELQAPEVPTGDATLGFVGWNWFVVNHSGVRLITHDGGTFGQSSLLTIAPELGFAIAVLTNSQSGGEPFLEAQKVAFKEYLGIEPPPDRLAGLTPFAKTPSELKEYVGRYETPTDGVDLTLRNGKLHFDHQQLPLAGQLRASNASPLPPLDLEFVGPDQVVAGSVEEPFETFSFARKTDGRIGWLRVGGRLIPRLK